MGFFDRIGRLAGLLAAALLLILAGGALQAAGQGMEIVALVEVHATVMSVEGARVRVDAGLAAGVRLGDIAEIYYPANVGAQKGKVVVNRGEVVEVDEFTAVLEVEPEFMVRVGYSAGFEVPQRRISPMGIAELTRSRLEERMTVADLRALIEGLVPEDGFIERQFLRVIEERQRRRGGGEQSAAARTAEARTAETSAASFDYEGEYHEPEILAVVQGWAQAWSDQDVGGYLSFYARDFRPPGDMSRAAWEALRRDRLSRPRFIRIALVFEEARSAEVGRGWARFRQAYRSDTYADAVTKRLELTWEDGDWKIWREIVGE